MAHTASRVLAVLAPGVLLLGLLASPLHAQDVASIEADPPSRAARLSHLEGDVSLQPVGEEDWAQAFVNRPLTTGDKLWTDRGRAEIQVGPAAVRLDANTGFSFLNVDEDTIQMRLTAGVMHVTVSRLDGSDQIEIDTPNVALWLLRVGTYRIEVNDAGDSTMVKVREGAADARSPSQDVVVHEGQAVTFTGTQEVVANIATLAPPDDFDAWSEERARRDERAASSRSAEYVSPEVTGYEDLDEHGTWSSEPDYGYVWTPRNVAVDWAPYRFGRWVWVSPWGWTWIDDTRWGYAPFHYGRWVHVRHRWCWVPGPRHIRPIYAPAVVGWAGRPGMHAWYPLGPRDVYVPWRRHSWRYMERVNTSNTSRVIRSHILEAYEDRGPRHRDRDHSPRGLTAATRDAFISAGHVRDHRVHVDDRTLSGAIRRAAAPDIAPARESRLGAPRAQGRTPPRLVAERTVVARREPPSVARGVARQLREHREVASGSVSGLPQPRRDESRARAWPRGDRPSDGPSSRLSTDLSTDPRTTWRRDSSAATPAQPARAGDVADRIQQIRERRMRDDASPHDRWREAPRVERATAPAAAPRWQRSEQLPQQQHRPETRDRGQQIRERLQQRHAEPQPSRSPQPRVEPPRAEPRRIEPRQVHREMSRPQVERGGRSEAPKPQQAPPRRDDNYSRPRRQ